MGDSPLCPLRVETEQVREGDILRERYTFINETNREVFTKLTDIAIYATFNDDYTTARECMHHKCHTHIWCGGAVSYVMALRMGGAASGIGADRGSFGRLQRGARPVPHQQ